MTWYIESGPDSDFIVSSRVRLARNLKGHLFPNRMTAEQARKLALEVTESFFRANSGMHDRYLDVDLAGLAPEERLSLVERRLISDDLLKHSGGRAIISRDESASIMINEEDHIRIQVMAPGLNVREAYKNAVNIAKIFEEQLPVAFDRQYGFLTACPTNTGTGLRASVMMHLPGITERGQIRGLIENLQKLGFTVRGNYGENSAASGYLYQISNQITLGLSEEDLLSDLEKAVAQTMDLERSARKAIYGERPLQTEDKVYRALAILQSARILTSEEALQLISDVRLGVELKVVTHITPEQLNRLQINIGPGTIQKAAGHSLDTVERDRYRADLCRQYMSQRFGVPPLTKREDDNDSKDKEVKDKEEKEVKGD